MLPLLNVMTIFNIQVVYERSNYYIVEIQTLSSVLL